MAMWLMRRVEREISRPDRIKPSDRVKARKHIAATVEQQRAARGSTEYVSLPKARKLGRRAILLGVWVKELLGRFWRRLVDSHRFPGGIVSRVRLYRPWQTVTPLVLFWIAVALAIYGVVRFAFGGSWNGLPLWGLTAAIGALVAALWLDGIKSPYLVRRIRRRVIEDPTALLRLTLAKQTTKVMELEPPLDTVPRHELYNELIPGALTRTKDTQIIVADPGAGKTTALLDLAKIMARLGLVPVLLQLRGERGGGDLFERAKAQFETQVRPLVRVAADVDLVWRWLCRRRRLIFLIDDLDQIGFDGEAGFQMRRMLEDLAPEGQAVIVTARPSGVPAGIAASAITMEPLAFDTAVNIVAAPRKREPGATWGGQPSRRRIESWVEGGDLREAPLYLEALTEMTAVGVCPDLPEDPRQWEDPERPGRWRELSEKRREWNPLWVRYLLLQGFYERIVDGHVRRSLGIDLSDRERCVRALEGAALSVLGATGIEAEAAAVNGDEPEECRKGRPKRSKLVDFLGTDDRKDLDPQTINGRIVRRRREVSQHEAIDSGERLRILDRDQNGDPQFRHRIMQAFFAGRQLAEVGRLQGIGADAVKPVPDGRDGHVVSFDDWVKVLMDHHHPERLTAHLALTFAAVHADACWAPEHGRTDCEVSHRIVAKLLDAVDVNVLLCASSSGTKAKAVRAAKQFDPMLAPDPYERADPDDNLVKLTTAANVVALLRLPGQAGRSGSHSERIVTSLESTRGAMRWTKQRALPAIAGLDTQESWVKVWKWFARDNDYEVRRSASRQLGHSARQAFAALEKDIEKIILRAGHRAAVGLPFAEQSDASWNEESIMSLEALGWVLPAIVSGLNEEIGAEQGATTDSSRNGDSPDGNQAELDLRRARSRLAELVALAFEGGRPKLEDSLAQGFKADAMQHCAASGRVFAGPGWVAGNRRMVADIGLPLAESWYARMLLYQALVLYAVAGTGRTDTLDLLAHRLHGTRERHPLAREAARLARAGLRRAELGSERWNAFVWSDDVEGGGGLPASLGRRAGRLVSDVTVLVDLKEGSPRDQDEKFGHMEELPHCLSTSHDRHEILGGGCPDHCGWGFCPYRASAPDEPSQHRGISRGFCRAQRRVSLSQRPPVWQRKIRRRKMLEFWRQMEYKARR